VAISDSTGNVVDRFNYSPYGAVAHTSGSTDTPFQYNGELGVQTDLSGLVSMRAWYYNPRIMRFVNADPTGFGDGTNRCSFA
jgi:RHS repeat-associated protein